MNNPTHKMNLMNPRFNDPRLCHVTYDTSYQSTQKFIATKSGGIKGSFLSSSITYTNTATYHLLTNGPMINE